MTSPVNPALVPPGPAGGTPPIRPARAADHVGRQPPGPAFADVLRESGAAKQPTRSDGVSFSGHALQRIERRGIVVDEVTRARLGEGVDRAASKGSRAAVVLIDQNAFVVGVPTRTVITAVGRDNMREHVFTNIDAAVIA